MQSSTPEVSSSARGYCCRMQHAAQLGCSCTFVQSAAQTQRFLLAPVCGWGSSWWSPLCCPSLKVLVFWVILVHFGLPTCGTFLSWFHTSIREGLHVTVPCCLASPIPNCSRPLVPQKQKVFFVAVFQCSSASSSLHSLELMQLSMQTPATLAQHPRQVSFSCNAG